eukprot:UN24902
MQDIQNNLRSVYNAKSCILIPGSGTYAMESVARHFGTGKKVMVLRNGYFSFRWSDIFETTGVAAEEKVLKAQPLNTSNTSPFVPHSLDKVIEAIKSEKPDIVFAPHVETATGMILTDDYMTKVAEAIHSYGGLFCIDAIAAGCVWVDMKKVGIDILISAPQKSWTGPACVGIVMLGEDARKRIDDYKPEKTSFCCRLRKWLEVADKYEAGGSMYYTTLPTDSLMSFRDRVLELKEFGFEKARERTWELGKRVRAVLEENGFSSVSGPDNQSPGVVVSYSPIQGL